MKLFKTVKTGVLFIDYNKIQLYVPTHPNVFTITFPETIIKDLEILNQDEFKKALIALIETNKIPPVHLLITLSNSILFEQEFPDTTQGQPQITGVPQFLDSIPFENISTKTFKLPKSTMVIATNRDYYEITKEPFEARGFIVEAVSPIKSLGKDLISVTNVDKEIAKKVIKRGNVVKQNALEIYYELKPSDDDTNKIPKNLRLYVLIAVFALLMFTLGRLIYKTFVLDTQTQKKPIQIQQRTNTPTPRLSMSPEPIASSSSSFSDKTTRIQLQYQNSSDALSSSLSAGLKSGGFENVNTQVSTQSASITTRIIFLPTISNEIRQKIIDIVKVFDQNATIQENPESPIDVVILLRREQ